MSFVERYMGSIAIGITGPAYQVASVTPADDTDLPGGTARAIMVGTKGDVKVTTANGDEVVLPKLSPGMWHAVFVDRIWDTGTNATEIVVGY